VKTLSTDVTVGTYARLWDGTNTAGAIVPAAKYRIEQVVSDNAGHSVTFVNFATVSAKRMTWTSVTKTLDAKAWSRTGRGSGATFPASGYTGGWKLNSSGSFAYATYEVQVPSATVYKDVRFSVLGRTVSGPEALIGLWNPGLGMPDDPNAYDQFALAGKPYGWYSTTAPSGHESFGVVAGMLLVLPSGGQAAVFDARDVSVSYTYGVLR